MKKYILVLIGGISLWSCENQVVQYPVSYNNDDFMQRSQERGKSLLKEEIEWFNEYKKKHTDFTFNKTESGIWISNQGVKTEQTANVGSYVNFTYQVYDINDQIIYSFDQIGEQKIILGKAKIARGIHSAIQLIEPNQQTRILLPSFLAYGGIGDNNKIEPNQPIIVDILIKEVKKH